MRGSELIRTAFSNLKKINLNWQFVEEENTQFLMAEGHPYAAEKILDRNFMATAAEQLSSSKLAIGIPCRGIILAANANEEDSRAKLESLIFQYFNDVSKTQVSDLIYVVENGQITDFQIIKKVKAGQNALTTKPKIEFPIGFQHHLSTIKIMTGRLYYKAMVSAPKIKILLEGCYQIILKVLQENGYNPNFTGHVELQTIPLKFKKTEVAQDAVNAFFGRLASSSILLQWAKQLRKDLTISLIFGEDYQKGAFENKFEITIKS